VIGYLRADGTGGPGGGKTSPGGSGGCVAGRAFVSGIGNGEGAADEMIVTWKVFPVLVST
jgi:hypothetical protein